MRNGIQIVVDSIAVAILYGICHDLVTAHISPEYFLPPIHAQLLPTENPVFLALIWGVVATWWVGLGLGALLALGATLGPWPPMTAAQVRPLLLKAVAVHLGLAYLTCLGVAILTSRLPEVDPVNRRIGIAMVTHLVSYWLAPIVALVLTVLVLRHRTRHGTARIEA